MVFGNPTCPLKVAMGTGKEDGPGGVTAQDCKKDCAWLIGSSCAIKVIAQELMSQR